MDSLKKSPLLTFIKLEPTFLTGSLTVCLSAPVPAFTQEFRSGRPSSAEAIAGKQGEVSGRGVWGESFGKLRTSFRPPSSESSVRIFSNRHRQLGNEVIGSPRSCGARQPFFGEIFRQRRICLRYDKFFFSGKFSQRKKASMLASSCAPEHPEAIWLSWC